MKYTEIISEKNPLIKRVKRLLESKRQRYKEKAFIVEGLRGCQEVPEVLQEAILVSKAFLKKHSLENEHQLQGAYVLEDTLFSSISDTQHTQGILMVAKMPPLKDFRALLASGNQFVCLENIQDPGNLGTIIRSGEAAGMSGLFLTNGSVDMYNPKVVRSTMGSLFRLPISYVPSALELIEEANLLKAQIYGTAIEVSQDFKDVEYHGKTLVFMGNEGEGLQKATLEKIPNKIHIPMQGMIESLNLSVATSLIMYEISRKK